MALTRKFLRALGIEDDKIDQIIDAHTETVDGLKEALEKAQADADKLPDIQKQLETAQADLDAAKKDSYKVKYEALKEDFEGYKEEQAKKETRAAKETAYRAFLREAGISEKRLDTVIRCSDVDGIELTEKGAIKGADRLRESVMAEWSDFIVETHIEGANTPNPPANTGGGTVLSTDEIMKVDDYRERQQLWGERIAANPELYR